MPRKSKTERDRETAADDMLLRALRQLADEALVEEVPERLLRPLREAQRRQQADGEPRQGADDRRAPGSGCGSSGRKADSRRRESRSS